MEKKELLDSSGDQSNLSDRQNQSILQTINEQVQKQIRCSPFSRSPMKSKQQELNQNLQIKKLFLESKIAKRRMENFSQRKLQKSQSFNTPLRPFQVSNQEEQNKKEVQNFRQVSQDTQQIFNMLKDLQFQQAPVKSRLDIRTTDDQSSFQSINQSKTKTPYFNSVNLIEFAENQNIKKELQKSQNQLSVFQTNMRQLLQQYHMANQFLMHELQSKQMQIDHILAEEIQLQKIVIEKSAYQDDDLSQPYKKLRFSELKLQSFSDLFHARKGWPLILEDSLKPNFKAQIETSKKSFISIIGGSGSGKNFIFTKIFGQKVLKLGGSNAKSLFLLANHVCSDTLFIKFTLGLGAEKFQYQSQQINSSMSIPRELDAYLESFIVSFLLGLSNTCIFLIEKQDRYHNKLINGIIQTLEKHVDGVQNLKIVFIYNLKHDESGKLGQELLTRLSKTIPDIDYNSIEIEGSLINYLTQDFEITKSQILFFMLGNDNIGNLKTQNRKLIDIVTAQSFQSEQPHKNLIQSLKQTFEANFQSKQPREDQTLGESLLLQPSQNSQPYFAFDSQVQSIELKPDSLVSKVFSFLPL